MNCEPNLVAKQRSVVHIWIDLQLLYIYIHIYIYIYIWTLIITVTIVAMLFCGSTHNTPCCYVFYSWLMLLCCNYSGHKTRYDRDNNIPSEPSPAPTPPTRSRVQRKRSRCQPRLYKPSPGTRVSDHLRPSDRGLITHLDEDGFRARVCNNQHLTNQ